MLHSRFTRKDRNKIEQSLATGLPTLLVSTQVVEVSLDLSFEQMFTEPAPIDALVQRMGRTNRRGGQTSPALVRIFSEQYSDANIPYRQELRDRSLAILTSLPSPLTEEDLNKEADKVYGNGYVDKEKREYEQGLNYEKLKDWKRYLTAGTNQDWIDQVIDQSEGTIELLPESLVKEYNRLRQDKLIIEANNLLVPVPRYRLPKLLEDNMIIKTDDNDRDPWILAGCTYDSKIGLDLNDNYNSLAGHI